MQVILHVGQHKTGTTSVQRYMADNARLFIAYGIYIPATGQAQRLGHHRPLMVDFGENGGKEFIANFKEEISRHKVQRLLVSSEVVKNYIVEGRYYSIFDAFRSAGATSFKIIMYVRNPFHLMNAAYSQQTKTLAAKGVDIRTYVDRYLSPKYRGSYEFFNYHRVIELAQQPDTEMILRPYSAAVAKSVVTDFVGTLGLPQEGTLLEPRTNISPGPIAIEVLRTVGNEIGRIEQSARQKLQRKLNTLVGDFPESAPYWGIDDDIAASAALAKADQQTELLSQFAWSKPWRETIGDHRPPVNVFHPAAATAREVEIYETMLARMRKTAAEILS